MVTLTRHLASVTTHAGCGILPGLGIAEAREDAPMSVHWPIIRACIRSPRRVAIVDDQRSYRHVELLVAAMHVASEIERRCDATTIGILLPTSGACAIAVLAGWIAGKTVVPLNFLLKREELQFVIDDCGTDTIISATQMFEFLGYEPTAKSLVRMDQINFKSLPDLRWPASAADDDLAVLLYTSGTSGKPKGVMLTHANLSANIRQIREWVGFGPRHTLMGVLPQFHSFGLTVLTLVPLTLGCKVIYSARFVPTKIVKLIREHRPTAFVGIPSMYGALLQVKDAKPEDFASLEFTVSGGEPLPDDIATRFHDRFHVRINEGYGLTETAPVTNWCRPHEYRPHSVGKPLPNIDERIIDIDSGEVLPPGKDGEIRIKGPNVMRGYFNRPEETAAAFDDQGYFRTGDMGRFDDDGHLYITGRLKEMLIVGGENVFPREIEEVLNAHESIAASAVVGLRDPVRGEIPVAFVELVDGATFNEKSLQAWCRERLAGYKIPRDVHHLEALPRNPTGKILRRELAERLASMNKQ